MQPYHSLTIYFEETIQGDHGQEQAGRLSS